MSSIAFELALANRILAHEGILNAFGHLSCRDPGNPARLLISVGPLAILVQEQDILTYGIDERPTAAAEKPFHTALHAEIYKARPDVHSICHHHAPAIMPFCISGKPLQPVTQKGGTMGDEAPCWDSQDEFGDTDLVPTLPEHGRSVARSLGPNWIVLMRRQGAVVVGRSLREAVFRSMHIVANAAAQMAAGLQGAVHGLRPGEIALTGNLRPTDIERNWAYAKTRLALAEAV